MSPHTRLDTYHFYEQEWEDIEELRDAFEWECPDEFNIASYVCDRWSEDPDRVALHHEQSDGAATEVTYAEIQRRANRLASFLDAEGVDAGDRVGICLPPGPAVIAGHMAVLKLGAISVPLNTLFGPDALRYRLDDCGAMAVLTGEATIDAVRSVAPDLDTLETIVAVDEPPEPGEIAYDDIQSEYDDTFETTRTDPEDDAFIIYTSGTTGDPKGVVHAHRYLLGALPLMCRCFMFDHSTDGQVWWTPIDWSWIGPLSATLVGMYYGIETVAYDSGSFDPDETFALIDKYDVTWFGGPPTMLRMMKDVENVEERFDVGTLDVIGTGGGKIDPATTEWAQSTFDGATIQDTYGQTESGPGNIAGFAPLAPIKRGKLGVAVPGNDARIVDEQTREPLDTGEVGEIAIKYDTQGSCFKRYWGLPEKTDAKVEDGWLYTEDLGTVDEEGYFEFVTRKDDLIISSGYKVSPEEIEDTLAKHQSVADAGVIGVPHETRGEVARAYVTLNDRANESDELKDELQSFVKDELAKYEYPREVEFTDELPLTATGKISRTDLKDWAGLTED
jgi:acetyl-CoA synthetase